ncbi:polysaccharide deacetylase family protein [Hathewaya histolytica]|uniref:Polysaccharide deacetylase family protein n=1 Tax=Hathewaya histolytica TaxID=1498 RepID=A0A4U9R5Z8_HATHI|nr:polysaccharide deacetylase family protein [Hathewaya histolytica]VTQ85991.1 polysaccharide deacetylase family protein [Hathewaya histolytica]
MKKGKIIIILVMLCILGGMSFLQIKKNFNFKLSSKHEKNLKNEENVNSKESLKKEVKHSKKEGSKESAKIETVSKETREKSLNDGKLENGRVLEKDSKENISYIKKDPKEVQIPILMYHSISDKDPKNGLLVPRKQFKEQVEWLHKNGFTPMLMEDVLESINTGKVPKRPVALTFDDGYVDNYNDAYKILSENNMKGTFFVITDCTNASNEYMNLEMLKEMKEKGMGIESHTHNHLELVRLSKQEKINSIRKSQEFLKSNLGVDSKYLCYPVGKYDKETIEVAKSLGIKGAVTTKNGFAKKEDGELSLRRIRISPMKLEAFKEIFNKYMN